MKVVLTKHSRRPEVKTFDGVEELSSEQGDGILNFIRCRDVSAVLPTGLENRSFNSIIFQLIPGLCGIQRLFQKPDSDCFLPA